MIGVVAIVADSHNIHSTSKRRDVDAIVVDVCLVHHLLAVDIKQLNTAYLVSCHSVDKQTATNYRQTYVASVGCAYSGGVAYADGVWSIHIAQDTLAEVERLVSQNAVAVSICYL